MPSICVNNILLGPGCKKGETSKRSSGDCGRLCQQRTRIGRATPYQIRGEHNSESVVDDCPQMVRYLRPWNRLDVFEPLLPSQAALVGIRVKFLHTVAGKGNAFRPRDVQTR